MDLSKIPIRHVMRAASQISWTAIVIALIGIVASYWTQVELLWTHQVGYFSIILPATVDLLGFACARALQLPKLDTKSRWGAGLLLCLVVTVSVVANTTDAPNRIAAGAHAWPVLAYLAGEWLANRVRAYAERVRDARDKAEEAARQAQVAAAAQQAMLNAAAVAPTTVTPPVMVQPAPAVSALVAEPAPQNVPANLTPVVEMAGAPETEPAISVPDDVAELTESGNDLPDAPVSPAPAPQRTRTQRREGTPHGPRDLETGYSERQLRRIRNGK